MGFPFHPIKVRLLSRVLVFGFLFVLVGAAASNPAISSATWPWFLARKSSIA